MVSAKHMAMARAISALPDHKHPLKNPSIIATLDPNAQRNLKIIASDPTLSAIATGNAASHTGNAASQTTGGGPSATDPTGSSTTNAQLGWGNAFTTGRNPRVRHVLLGFAATVLAAGAANVVVKATPNVDFKPNRMVIQPGFSGTIAGVQSGIRPQYVSNAAEDADMYQPLSYGGELDLDAVRAAVSIVGQITNSNATASQTFYGAFIGQAIGMPYRRLTSKLMDGSMGTSGSVSASGTGSLVLTPLIQYTARKVLFTPGASFSDAFIITSITAGIQNQLMSGDPIPASVFSDLYPLFVDLDVVKPSVPLTIAYQNVSAGAATLKGTTRGDVNPMDLARYSNMSDVGGSPAGA